MSQPFRLRFLQWAGLAAALFPLVCLGALTWDNLEASLLAKPNDKELVAFYRFKNSGTIPVTITDIQASCGCTTVELDKHTYAPGESGSIRVTFSTAAYTGVLEYVGPLEKTITVTTSDAPSKPVSLRLHVNVQQLLNISPEVLFWPHGSVFAEKSVLVNIASPLRIESLSVTGIDPADTVTRVETVTAGSQYRVYVRPVQLAQIPRTTVHCEAKFTDCTVQNFTIYGLAK